MRHAISILVENRFGELPRVIGLFTARGLEIESLTLGETTESDVSRLTIVTRGSEHAVEQVTRVLDKQVRVIRARNTIGLEHIERETVLVRIRAEAGATRQEVLNVAAIFHAEVLDVSHDELIVEATGDRGKLSALIELLRPLGIREIARTGPVAMAKLAEKPLTVEAGEAEIAS